MPTLNAPLLPAVPLGPPVGGVPSLGAPDASMAGARRLDEVGVETVLGAMIEQKRRSSRPAPCELGESEEQAGQRGFRPDTDVFQKVR
jgi:hypothetical protein